MLARAALYLECARFVHRCNRGAWPEWMKGHFLPVPRRGLSRGRSPVPGTRRNQRLQWNAARLFYQWGEVIIVSFTHFYSTHALNFTLVWIHLSLYIDKE